MRGITGTARHALHGGADGYTQQSDTRLFEKRAGLRKQAI